MKLRNLVGVVALGALLASVPASATWIEVNAGQLTGSADVTTGSGSLNAIEGRLDYDLDTSTWDIDLYRISITNPLGFSAQTTLVNPGSFMADPVLFLFSADGFGIFLNDDESNSSLQSLLSGGLFGPTLPGIYYLGIAWSFSDPLSDLGSIFPLYELGLATDGVYGPSGTGGAGPLTSWLPGGPSNFDLGSNYRILLTGASAAAVVPEPGTALLLAVGALALFARRRVR